MEKKILIFLAIPGLITWVGVGSRSGFEEPASLFLRIDKETITRINVVLKWRIKSLLMSKNATCVLSLFFQLLDVIVRCVYEKTEIKYYLEERA